jgi:DNA-binding PadR family transcriptional regulator
MNLNDLILLSILNEKELVLSKIVEKLRELEMEKLPTRTAIYSRLSVLSKRNLVKTFWKEGAKIYKSSENGKQMLNKLKTTLNKFN